MKKLLLFLSLTLLFLIFFNPLQAHSGRTDSNGGHYDRSTGIYHYHNQTTSGGSDSPNVKYAVHKQPVIRILSVSSVYTPTSADATVLYWNPAGLSLLDGNEIGIKHLVGVENNYCSFVTYSSVLSEISTFGFGTSINNEGAILTFGLGFSISDFIKIGFSLNGVPFKDSEITGDSSLMYMNKAIFIGTAFQNLNGLSSTDLFAGYSYSIFNDKLDFATEINYDEELSLLGDIKYHLGYMTLNIGYSWTRNTEDGFNAGLGYLLNQFSFDYMLTPLDNNNYNHMISVVYRY